mmetsp:Transcript_55149/g.175421  ORF Transcript_55149/g.175421 Transcript_55149/m.175421 type:complete len:291 (-) Transcript_55149:202-1074(-)
MAAPAPPPAYPVRKKSRGNKVVDAIFKYCWERSYTSARIDLRRPVSAVAASHRVVQSGGMRAANSDGRKSAYERKRGEYSYGSGPPRVDSSTHYRREDPATKKRLWQRVHTGARLKLLRVWEFGKEQKDDRRLMERIGNLGVGINVEMDGSRIEPRARLNLKIPTKSTAPFDHMFSLRLAPFPSFNVKFSCPIFETGVCLDLHYGVPLNALNKFYTSPAVVGIRLFNPVGSGLHLTPSGLEFDERVLKIGDQSALRLGASVDIPHSLPVEEGDSLLNFDVHRLGLKTRLP